MKEGDACVVPLGVRGQRGKLLREVGQEHLAHLSFPLRLQNDGPVNLAALHLKERKITLAANIYKAAIYTDNRIPRFSWKNTWRLHPLLAGVAGAEQQLPAFSGALALRVASAPPLYLVLNQSVSLLHMNRLAPGGIRVCDLQENPWRGTFEGL